LNQAKGAHLRANGIRQHYLQFAGPGPCVLVVPGIISPAILWSHVGASLGENYNCILLDVRGRGLSEAGPHLDYGLDACARDLVAFAGAVDVGPAIAVGHSMGARIALRAAAMSPGLFSGGIVLVDPPTSGPGRRAYPVPKARTLKLLQAAHRGEADELLAKSGAPSWPVALQQLRVEWLATCDERAVHAAYDDFHGQDMFADLSQTSGPISLICAGEGGVVSDMDIEEMRSRRADLVSARLAGLGHQMQAEGFDEFRLALGDILGRHRQIMEENRN
jgi:N-formylmaleamate deformylase